MRVLADYHHGSLLRSLVMLFEGRLGMELYRPIGLEWFHEGYWAVSELKRTAREFLEPRAGDRSPSVNVTMAVDPGRSEGEDSQHERHPAPPAPLVAPVPVT